MWFLPVVLVTVSLAGITAGHGGSLGGVTIWPGCDEPVSRSSWCSVVDFALAGRVYHTALAGSPRLCWAACASHPRCLVANYALLNGTCEFLDSTYHDSLELIEERRGWVVSHSRNNTLGCGPQSLQPTQRNQASSGTEGWPFGTYGLPMPDTGCPTNAGFTWVMGSRFHDTENNEANNEWSSPIHMRGPYEQNDMTQHFCMKTVERVGTSARSWPSGKFCVFQYDGCPEGMTSGSIYWDDEDYGTSSVTGTLPSGEYSDSNTRVDYCCMVTGDVSQPIDLPTDEGAFYLFPLMSEPEAGPQCQLVRGKTASLEWFKWDNEDSDTHEPSKGAHPHHTYSNKYNNLKIYYCYYQAP